MDAGAIDAYTLAMPSPSRPTSARPSRPLPDLAAGPRPHLLWRVGVLAGVGTMVVLATSDRAWEAWDDATGGRLPRRAVRALLVATGVVHVAEAVATHRRATALGLEDRGRWVRSTLVYGFPALVRLRRAGAPVGSAPAGPTGGGDHPGRS